MFFLYKWLIVWVFANCFENGQALRKHYMEDDCSGTIDMESSALPAGRLSVTRRSKYRSALSCAVTIKAPLDRQIVVVFREMDIEYEAKCDDDFVSLHDGPNTMSPIVAGTRVRMCGHTLPRGSYASRGNTLTVFFQSDIYHQNNGFEIVFTAFHKSQSCFVDELKCANGRCISDVLRCNNFDNCGDASDECKVNFDNCGDASDECKVDSEVMVAIVLSIFLLTVVAVGIVLIVRRRNLRKASKKVTDLKSAIKKVTGSKFGYEGIEIHPCEACSFKIVKSEREKKARLEEAQKMATGIDNEAMKEDHGIYTLGSHLDYGARFPGTYRNSI